MTALLVAAALSCLSPQGRLTLIKSERPAREALEVLGRGRAQAFWLISDSPSQSWFRFLADWDGPITWPKGQTVAATLRDGRTVEASSILVAGESEAMAPTLLGLATRTLNPSELSRWRGETVLFVAFPDPRIGLKDIVSVEIVHSGGRP